MNPRVTIRCLGFSLSILVDTLSYYSGTAFFGLSGFSEAENTLCLFLLIAARIVIFLVAALITGRSAYREPTTPTRRKLTVILCTLLSLAGLALIAVSIALNVMPLLVVGALAFGAGQGLLSILWLLTLVSFDYRGSYLYILSNHALATLLCVFFLLAPLSWLFPIVIVCSAISSVALFFTPTPDRGEVSTRSQMSFVAPRLGGWILIVGLFALASGFMQNVSASLATDVDPASYLYTSLGTACVVLAIMLIPALVFKRPLQIETSYRIALPLAALGFLILPGLTNLVPPYFAGTLTFSGYMVTGIIIYCSIAELVRVTKVNPLPLFAAAEALTLVFFFLGKGAGTLFAPDLELFHLGPALIGAGSLYLLTIGASWVFSRERWRAPHTPLTEQRSDSEPPADPESLRSTSSVDEPQRELARPLLSLDEVADNLELSEQGRIIFMQLIEGRSLPRIADDLFLSTSSIKYYTQKIYRALDVHARGEFFEAVERKRRGED